MSGACNLLPDLESCRNKPLERPAEREEAIRCYSEYIKNVEELLTQKENDENRDDLCKQIALGYNERGFVKYQQVDFEEAIEDYTKALTYDSQLHFTFYNRGLIHYRLARFDQAIDDMNRALELKTDFEPALKCLKQAKIDIQFRDKREN